MADWFEEGGSGSPVDVAKVMDSKAADLVWELIAGGVLVSLGTTSDGGALGITVTLDGRWRRQYFRETEEAVSWLEGAVAHVLPEAKRQAAPSGRQRRTRRS